MPGVIISGAGPAGLTLAIELARRDVDFLLIDKAPRPFPGSRGKGIQPRTLEVFEDLGVVDRMVAAGGEFPVQRIYTEAGAVDRRVMEHQEPTPAEPYRNPLLLPQFRTESLLRDRLADLGHAPAYGRELLGLHVTEDGVTARIGDQSVHASFLVGCDGGASPVRKALGIGYPGKSLGIRAFVADVRSDSLSADAWHTWHEGDRTRQITMCPLAGTDLFQCQGGLPLEGDVDVSAAGLTEMLRERTGRTDLTITDVPWASVFLMGARLADAFRSGRAFLAGDAAHTHPPTGGQGLNTSVQDAYNLGWKLAAVLSGTPDPELLLDSYEIERRGIAESVLGLSTRLLDEAARRGMRRGRDTQQLDLGYPTSPLNGPGALSGYRAPDAPLLTGAGHPTRLFTLLAGPHWTLLAHETTDTPAPRAGLHIHTTGPTAELQDPTNHLATSYKLTPGTYVLIRPDNYVALTTTDHNAIDAYLTKSGL
jgi:2-polyprenyl-6-methoxyphenol hydroxylase-like FAD-dependent oxidoreductase